MSSKLEPGDILLASTDVDDTNVDLRNHSGRGRILHYDAAFVRKGELWTGETGLVVGLGFDARRRELYAADPGAQAITRFDARGERLAPPAFLPRARYGSVLFLPDGRFLAGVHSRRGEPADAPPTPRLYLCSLDEKRADGLDVEVDGGRFGFHCLTHMSLAPDGRTLYYVSETGRRVMRYDIEERRQLDDFLVLGADDPRGTYGLAVDPAGNVLMATGTGASRFTPDARLDLEYPVPARRGWSRLQLARDGATYWLSNFLEGILEQRRIDDGTLVRAHDVERKFSLCGLVEVPPG